MELRDKYFAETCIVMPMTRTRESVDFREHQEDRVRVNSR